jgi:hypothetical protein
MKKTLGIPTSKSSTSPEGDLFLVIEYRATERKGDE